MYLLYLVGIYLLFSLFNLTQTIHYIQKYEYTEYNIILKPINNKLLFCKQ